LDFLTGYEIAFSLFYVMPISLLTWSTCRWPGIIAAIASALVWLWADVVSGHVYLYPVIPLWNALIRLSFFIIIALLLSRLKDTMEREKALARTGYLTGAVNSRLFFDLFQVEIDRSQRYEHPFTLAYIDLDNFKTVNDQFGHLVGDEVLRTVVRYVKTHIRKTDVVARLGGDEFALLLPETTQESAHVALTKLHDGLLEEMQQNQWSITFSVGVLTCNATPPKTDELVRMVDELMYSVKYEGKNAIVYSTYAG
jgi:diguanylate cyclase (GGDEF)-like protein